MKLAALGWRLYEFLDVLVPEKKDPQALLLRPWMLVAIPWEPKKTFIFRGYNPYIEGLKPSFFMGTWGSKGS